MSVWLLSCLIMRPERSSICYLHSIKAYCASSSLSKLVLFERSECPEIGFLGFRQPLHVRDVYALVWPLPDQCLEAVESLDIPEFDGSIIAACGKGMSTRAESHPPYPVSVSPHGTPAVTGVDIPQADSLILTATGKHVSIRVENDRSHPVCMTMENAQVAPTTRIP